jgi:hypothetical protein
MTIYELQDEMNKNSSVSWTTGWINNALLIDMGNSSGTTRK